MPWPRLFRSLGGLAEHARGTRDPRAPEMGLTAPGGIAGHGIPVQPVKQVLMFLRRIRHADLARATPIFVVERSNVCDAL